MAALALVGIIIMGCAENDLAANAPHRTVTVTTAITLDGTTPTRALTADGKKTFAEGDQVALVYVNTNDQPQKVVSTALKATEITDGGKKAVLTFTLNDPKAGSNFSMFYPASIVTDEAVAKLDGPEFGSGTLLGNDVLAKQDGTLASLASKFDLASYDGNLSDQATLPGSIALTNQFAIGEFTIKNEDGTSDLTNKIIELTIKQGPYTYTVNRTAAAGPIYVAMWAQNDVPITIGASDPTTFYEKTVDGKTLQAGSMYPITVKMPAFDALSTPLTLEATEDETTITVMNGSNKTFQYAQNGGSKTVESGGVTINMNAGDIVQFFSTNSSPGVDGDFRIKPDKKTYVYGNVMSLIDDNRTDPDVPNFANDKTIGADNALYGLFWGASNLASHDKKDIVLPATDLTSHSYALMFRGCSGLTRVPNLPATTLQEACYYSMFYNCTGLTTLPEDLLPAGKNNVGALADGCYHSMFSGCSSLTNAPELPATTLKSRCYSGLFIGCTSLTTAPQLPAITLQDQCYSNMFLGCTSLTTAPVLPATTLTNNCYDFMFNGCGKLSSVTCFAKDITATNCVDHWLDGAGTEEGCERKVYVDPFTTINYDKWQLGTSGTDGKRWTIDVYVAKSCALSEVTKKEIGWRIGSDGTAYEQAGRLPIGVTPIAIIAYVGDGDHSEGHNFHHGLALAMTDAYDASDPENINYLFKWRDDSGEACVCTKAYSTPGGDELINLGSGLGIANTAKLAGGCGAGHNHPAAKAAANYPVAHPTNTSGWFLPTIGQWNFLLNSLTGSKGVSLGDVIWANINPKITAAGGTGLRTSTAEPYWSSTEKTEEIVYECRYRSPGSSRSKTADAYVRPILAF